MNSNRFSVFVATLFLLTLAPAALGQPASTTPPPSDKPQRPQAPKDDDAAEAKLAYVRLTTGKGEIVLELNREKAPITVANFLGYVEDEFYDGTIFHRVMSNFMIQGGGFTRDMAQKRTKAAIKNEWRNGLKNERGTIAMARTNAPDSATAQFYINVKDNPALNGAANQPGYAVFGKVIAGMDVVDAIKEVRTSRQGPHEALPVEPVVIEKARRITAEDAKEAVEKEKAAKEKAEKEKERKEKNGQG